MPTAVGVVTEAPPLTPPPNGLLQSASVVEDESLRWENGTTYSPEVCGKAVVFDPCSTAGFDTFPVFTDAATTSGSPTLTSATARFNVRDIGKGISGAASPPAPRFSPSRTPPPSP